MYYCGIDIAKYKHEATAIDESGKALLDSISFSNTKEDCEKLLSLFERLNISKNELPIGTEATGHYWLSVHFFWSRNPKSLRVRGKHHLTAVGAVSRKLCNTIYAIFRKDGPWQAIPPKVKV